MYRYLITIEYDYEDKIYIVRIPDLSGCAAHGDTPEEALKELAIVYDMWIEVAKEEGIKIPEPTRYLD